jgi:hypothetical protein
MTVVYFPTDGEIDAISVPVPSAEYGDEWAATVVYDHKDDPHTFNLCVLQPTGVALPKLGVEITQTTPGEKGKFDFRPPSF